MIAVIDEHRGHYGVEPICRVLPVAPSTYYQHVAQRRDPSRLSARAQRDEALKPEVIRVFAENFSVYGVRKVWRQMQREGFDVARCTVQRLMRELGLQGVIRGKPVRTTISDKSAPCPLDQVSRQFHAPAPDRLWLSDFTYVATWAGFVYVAYVTKWPPAKPARFSPSSVPLGQGRIGLTRFVGPSRHVWRQPAYRHSKQVFLQQQGRTVRYPLHFSCGQSGRRSVAGSRMAGADPIAVVAHCSPFLESCRSSVCLRECLVRPRQQ